MPKISLILPSSTSLFKIKTPCPSSLSTFTISLLPKQSYVKDVGSYSIKGNTRKQNEDRLHSQAGKAEDFFDWFGAAHDGHGGYATADWLEKNLLSYIIKFWNPSDIAGGISDAFTEADSDLLKPRGGFLGMGERGVGGSKCGATTAIAAIIRDKSGAPQLLTANVGDARTLLVKGGEGIELFEEHVPDVESERKRIESKNPNPNMPLVRYVQGTWRVGGLLALSRAFGDAYMKGTQQFEGVGYQGSDYSSGFGVTAKPWVKITPLDSSCSFVVVASDGLFNEIERGGGGGLSPEEVAEALSKAPAGATAAKLADQLVEMAIESGSTDDVSCIVLKLDTAALPQVGAKPVEAAA